MNRRGASGIEGGTTQQFERERGARVQDLCARLQAGACRAPPVRRVAIPQGPGKEGTRPLGLPTLEDRLVQRAVARSLEAGFGGDSLACSYGVRPGRSPHQALRALRGLSVTKQVRQRFEADVRGCFDPINQQWLRQMGAHRMADPVIARLLGQGLRVGVRPGGVVTRTAEGTPQGGPSRPVLAKGYRHVGLDLWFEKKGRPLCQGEAYLTRFAADCVASSHDKRDAAALHRTLSMRFERFNRAFAEEETRRLLRGRFARARAAEYAAKPGAFDCLGFEHGCGSARRGQCALVRVPSPKSCRKGLARTKDWLKSHRPWERRERPRHLAMMLRGSYQYFALHHCKPQLDGVRCEVQRQWRRVLRRRSQRHRLFWSDLKSRAWFALPYAETLHPAV